MEHDVLIALLSLAGTLTGTLGGILTSARLTNYRIEQLEKKVDRHNGFGERIPVLEDRVTAISHRMDCLEGGRHEGSVIRFADGQVARHGDADGGSLPRLRCSGVSRRRNF